MKDTTASAERVGRYQLLEPIGVGCSGAVARAKVFGVAGFERQFAVKRFHAELTSTAAMAQALSAAARAYGSLEHPRIARMSEFGVAQGTTFTAVEFVAGLDAMRLLSEVKLAGQTLAAGGALTLISQAARAVGYAHGRGLSHLGLAPTNVIVTSDGDIKITDFGVLAATLPQQPTNVPRLANRIAYLAPEQIAGEATSAATDVFALGVIAYELVTGTRAFKGNSPTEIANAITSGPPLEPQLPRPIVRVLQRCLARSPFERFPDARALADALDAALRVAPVPGTRKDIGAQVKETLDRLAALNEGGHSGVVALNVGTGPVRRIEPLEIKTLGRDSVQRLQDSVGSESIELDSLDSLDPAMDVPTLDFMPPPPPTPPAANTVQDLPKMPPMTMPGVAAPPLPSLRNPSAPPASTLLGLSPAAKPRGGIPQIGPPKVVPTIPSAIPAIGSPPTPAGPVAPVVPADRATPPPLPAMGRVATRDVDALPRPPTARPFVPDGLASPVQTPSMTLVGTTPPPFASPPASAIRESAPALPDPPDDLVPREDLTPLPPPMPGLDGEVSNPAIEMEVEYGTSPGMAVFKGRATTSEISEEMSRDLQRQSASAIEPAVEAPPPPVAPPPAAPTPPVAPPTPPTPSATLQVEPAAFTPPPPIDDKPKSRAWIYALAIVGGLAVIGFIGWQVWDVVSDDGMPVTTANPTKKPDKPDPIASVTVDAGAAVVVPAVDASTGKPSKIDAAAAATIDAAGSAVAITVDAAAPAIDAAVVAVVVDAAVPTATIDAGKPIPVGTSDKLVIDSTPKGARVYLDGSDVGLTPATLPGSNDRHNIALLSPGHDLYIAQVDGHGSFTIPLKEVTPPGGPAGIKVMKCAPNRYYVFADGKPTGMLCPTERIEVGLGQHVIEIYDAVTEQRRKFDVPVADTRLSVRVRVE